MKTSFLRVLGLFGLAACSLAVVPSSLGSDPTITRGRVEKPVIGKPMVVGRYRAWPAEPETRYTLPPTEATDPHMRPTPNDFQNRATGFNSGVTGASSTTSGTASSGTNNGTAGTASATGTNPVGPGTMPSATRK